MPDLHRDQQAALDALGWLLTDHSAVRRRGRSTVQAIALIRHGLAHPGQRVPIDEFGTLDRSQDLAMTVANLLELDPRLIHSLRRELLLSRARRRVLFFDLPRPFPGAATWLPPGWRAPLPRIHIPPDLTEQELADLVDQDRNAFVPIAEPVHPEASFLHWIGEAASAGLGQWPGDEPIAEPPRRAPPPPEAARPQSLWQHLKED